MTAVVTVTPLIDQEHHRRWGLILLSVGIGLLFALLVLDVILRLLPVPNGLRTQPVNENQPIFRFEPNREYQFSSGWDFDLANRGHVNNAGFVSDIDYGLGHERVLAVVGDSYVEALMVPWGETLSGRVNSVLDCAAAAYAFAASGAPLSQYLVWAKHAREAYRAHGVVFVVVGNDFDESHASIKQGPGFHHFRERDGSLVLMRVDYEPGALRDIVTASAFARYLIFSLRVEHTLGRLGRRVSALVQPEAATSYVANTLAETNAQRMSLSRRSVDAFIEQLGTYAGYEPGEVLLLVDGIRPIGQVEDIETVLRESYFGRMREYLMTRAREVGIGVVDLQGVFTEELERTGERFEFDSDSHWNGRGHEVAARAILAHPLFSRVFAPDMQSGERGRGGCIAAG